jgi:hypothetical protein
MSKIRIDLESISVESFVTEGRAGGRGTVRAHDDDSTTLDRSEFCTLDCTVECSIDNALTCARRRSEIDSCINWCECTDANGRCV